MDEYYERFKKRREESEPMSVRERRQKLQAQHKAKMKKSTLEIMSANDFQTALEKAQAEAYEKGLREKQERKRRKELGSDSSSEEEEEEDNDDGDEEEEKTGLPDELRAARWFSAPEFAGIAEEEEDEFEEEAPFDARRV